MPPACLYALEIINKITNTRNKRESHMATPSVLATWLRALRIEYSGADSLLEIPHIQARDARKWLPRDGSGFAYRARRVGCTRVETGSRLLKKVARAAVFDTSIDFTPSAKLTPTQVTICNYTSHRLYLQRRVWL